MPNKNVAYLLAAPLDQRTLEVIQEISGVYHQEITCIDFSHLTGYKSNELKSYPDYIKYGSYQIIDEENIYNEIISALPLKLSTLKILFKYKKKTNKLSIISLYIPWEMNIKIILRSFFYRLVLNIKSIHSFGYLRHGWIFFKSNIIYHKLPGLNQKIAFEDVEENSKVLFIDQGLPMHPDISATQKKIDKDKYYLMLIETLINFSKQLRKPILICLHPSVRYAGDEFGEFEISNKKTNEEMLNASLVIGHYSLSLLDAASRNIPIIILRPNAELGNAVKSEINSIASLLEVKAYQIGGDDKLKKSHIAIATKASEFLKKYTFGIPVNDN